MAKYDEQLGRMLSLMEDKKSPVTVSSSVWTYRTGADGNVYGIVKEGTKFYIKTTEQGKEKLAESYDYLGGFNNRRNHEYKSYNEATKHLEHELMHINENYGKHEDVTIANLNKTEEAFSMLTEEAKSARNRMLEIMNESEKIGMNNIEDKESKGHSTGDETVKNNAPFSDKVTPKMDFSGSNGTVKSATDNKEVGKGVEADLQSDKKKTANSGSEKDYKDAHDDLDGEGVADKKPAGGKVVRVNEGYFTDSDDINVDDFNSADEDPAFNEPISLDSVTPPMSDEVENATDDESEDMSTDALDGDDDALVGTDSEDTDLDVTDFDDADSMANLEEMINEFETNLSNATKDTITGPEKTMDGPHGGLEVQTWNKMDEAEDGNVNDPTKQGNEEFMKSFNKKGNLPAQTWDKMGKVNESMVNAMVDTIYNKLMESAKAKKTMKESLEKKIQKIVDEEVSRLNVWGKHPRYGKEPMSLPDDKEVLAGTADRDFNDDSAKHNTRYGQKIGKGAPFEKVVDMLTDQVMAQLKEGRFNRK